MRQGHNPDCNVKSKALHRTTIAAVLWVSLALNSRAVAQDSVDSILADIKSELQASRIKEKEAQKRKDEANATKAARKKLEAEQRPARVGGEAAGRIKTIPGTIVLRDQTLFLQTGRRKASDPDLSIPKGVRVKLLRVEFGYSRVQLASGQIGYMATSSLGLQ